MQIETLIRKFSFLLLWYRNANGASTALRQEILALDFWEGMDTMVYYGIQSATIFEGLQMVQDLVEFFTVIIQTSVD